MELRSGLTKVFIILALALYALAFGGIVTTDAYSQAAGTEARGVHALVNEVLAGRAQTPMLADAPQAITP
jgi:hypothetical protein